MKTESEKAAACAKFDAFCKEVLRNAMVDYLRKSKHKVLHEMLVADPENYLGTSERTEDIYSTDRLYIKCGGYSYALDNETLFQAMCSLPLHLLGGLLLKYWQNQKDAKIAKQYGVTTRTIRKWRSQAIFEIQRWYDDNQINTAYRSSK